jgi:hypothetical protein
MSSSEQLNKETKKSKRIVNTDDEMSKKEEILYEKNKNKKDADLAKKSKIKLEKKSGHNRLIKSMQNLFFYDKSRSVSSEALESNNNNESNKKIERKSKLNKTILQ